MTDMSKKPRSAYLANTRPVLYRIVVARIVCDACHAVFLNAGDYREHTRATHPHMGRRAALTDGELALLEAMARHGFNQTEIAARLGISQGHTNKLLHRARASPWEYREGANPEARRVIARLEKQYTPQGDG